MKTTHRAYSEVSGDFRRLSRFITTHMPYFRTHSTWCLGRFVDWKYGLYENKTARPGFCERNAEIWFDAFDEVAGFAISESGDARIAILLAPGYRFLFDELLAWSLANWAERGPRFTVEVTERQALEMATLERHGFRCSTTFYTQRFDLVREPARHFPLEPGFVIVDMRSHADYRGQRILRDNAFIGITPTEEVLQRHIDFYNYSHAGPIYHGDTDLCVMAPDGQLVAGCEALIDAANVEADIERVCTHSDFRRRGFARTVTAECLNRLAEYGLRNAYITGYDPEAIALYRSLDATEEQQSFVYERA